MAEVRINVVTEIKGAMPGLALVGKELDALGTKAKRTSSSTAGLGVNVDALRSRMASMNPTVASLARGLEGVGLAGGASFATLAAGAGVVGALGVAIGAGVSHLASMGDRLTNLARQSRMTTDEVQRLEAGGRGLGISFEILAKESGFLEKTLGSRSSGTLKALNELNLSYTALSRMPADERLVAIHRALLSIADPLKQSALGAELLGKGFQKMTEVDLAEFISEAEGALILSRDAAKAGDELGDSWARLLADSKVLAAEGFAPLAEDLNSILNLITDVQRSGGMPDWVKAILEGGNPGGAAMGLGLAFGRSATGQMSDQESERIRLLVAGKMKIADEERLKALDVYNDAKLKGDDEREKREKELAALQKKAAEEEIKQIVRLSEAHAKAAGEAWMFWDAAWDKIEKSRLDADIDSALQGFGPLGFSGGTGLDVGGRFKGMHLSSTAPGVDFSSFGEGTKEAQASLLDLNSELANLAHLADLIGPKWASVFAGLSSGLAGLQSIQGGLGAIKGGGLMNLLAGAGGIASGVGAIAGPIIALLKGLGGPDIGRDVGRDIGANISEELEKAIEESGQNAQMFLREIFAEGDLGIDEFAREVGDLFSMFERGEISEGGLIGELKETLPILIENMRELGPAGEAEIDRILEAAKRLGVEFEGIGELLQSTFAPETMEQIAAGFGITNDQVRELSELLGVQIQTDLERMAANLGLTVEEFNALGAAVSEKFGIPAEQIDELLASMGVSAAELAAALGVDVAEGAGGLTAETAAANVELGIGVGLSGQLAFNLERAAMASGGIRIGSGGGVPDEVSAAGGFDHPMLRRTTRITAHAGEEVHVGPPGSGKRAGGGGVTVNITGGTIIGSSDEFRRQVASAIAEASRPSSNTSGLNTALRRNLR